MSEAEQKTPEGIHSKLDEQGHLPASDSQVKGSYS